MAHLDQVTALVLTYNEAPNIGRTLDTLRWAPRVVVLDSGSTDDTETIARRYDNVWWVVRPFDHHGEQWRFGIFETGISTPYVLTLDADHQVPDRFVRELDEQFLPGCFDGGIAAFEYRFFGHPLRGSLYPPKIVVFRKDRVAVTQPGHTQELSVPGPVYRFRVPLVHDDRKSVDRFVSGQLGYSRLEAARLGQTPAHSWVNSLRRSFLAAPVLALYAYLRAGGPFRGAAAARYAYERATFECLLALRLTTERLAARSDVSPPDGRPEAGP